MAKRLESNENKGISPQNLNEFDLIIKSVKIIKNKGY